MQNLTHVVLGLGEVGQAIQALFNCGGYAERTEVMEPYDVLHICFPYTPGFEDEVQRYQGLSRAKYTIIHSTTPIGTADKVKATASPIRGTHPHIYESLFVFPKYVGGEHAKEVAQLFGEKDITVYIVQSARDAEAMKLWDTLQYGMMILLEKEIHEFCEIHHLDFGVVYTSANQTYNEGYRQLGRPEVVRPFLKHVPGPIGGHCIIENAKLIETSSADVLIAMNDVYGKTKNILS